MLCDRSVLFGVVKVVWYDKVVRVMVVLVLWNNSFMALVAPPHAAAGRGDGGGSRAWRSL